MRFIVSSTHSEVFSDPISSSTADRFHHGTQDVHFRRPHERIVGASDDAQQIAHIVEQPARAFRDDHVAEHRYGKVCLADPGRPDEAETLARFRKRLGELARLLHSAEKFFVRVGDKGFEIAPAIPRRNARIVKQPRSQSLAPAVTSDDPANAVGFNSFPAGIVAKNAGHEGWNRGA